MGQFKCKTCGKSMEMRCKPKSCPDCGGGGIEKLESGSKPVSKKKPAVKKKK